MADRLVRDPIAIVGIACRLPGGIVDVDSYWRLLREGGDGIRAVPPHRWSLSRFFDGDLKKPGHSSVQRGGFMDGSFEYFDAAFFGISPREAEVLDPQQRLLLETSWEAFEDAGIPVRGLAGTAVGVYMGGFAMDSQILRTHPSNLRRAGSQSATSSTMTMLANRISYQFDLRGPSVSLDTACSSSLVAIHSACRALQSGDCRLALAGGVNVMLHPAFPIIMSKGGFMAADGRCKPFDAAADGYGRGEGAGVVVLKALSQALADGDRVYALILGTGVNQDGRTEGITVPNGAAQQALIEAVLEEAQVDAAEVVYAEAHGTGTPVGDPIEASALGSTLGRVSGRDGPLLVGSVKANIGHLEAGAGVAGLVKAALCLRHGQVPPQPNLATLNPNIPFEELGIRVPTVLETLPASRGRVCAAVNSFGYGGTNAFAILEQVPAAALADASAPDQRAEHPWLLPLSARSAEALRALAQRYVDFLCTEPRPRLADVCYSAALRRDHLANRALFIGDTREVLIEQLARFAEEKAPEVVCGRTLESAPSRPVFVFTGMGPQWWGMGRELLEQEPVFRVAVEAADAAFEAVAGWSILAEMLSDEADSRMADTRVAQPANVCLQIGLLALWRSRGIEPAAIVGHSVGEVTAAYAAGVLDLADTMLLAHHRSRVQHMAAGQGAMLALGLPAADIEPEIANFGGRVSIAAINSPVSVTLAGDQATLDAIGQWANERGVFYRAIRVEVPYHSIYMEPLKPELAEALAGLRPQRARLPLYSTVTGEAIAGPEMDAQYWCRNMRDAVRFADAVNCLAGDNYRVFLEVGPHPVLASAIRETTEVRGSSVVTVHSLRRNEPEQEKMLRALAELHVAGVSPDWTALLPAGRWTPLPHYPWQRELHWDESREGRFYRLGSDGHPLLGLPTDAPLLTWQDEVSTSRLPYLADHRVQEAIVFPGAGYAEIGLAVHRAVGRATTPALADLRLLALLTISAEESPLLRVEYDEAAGTFRISSRPCDQEESHWTEHARGRVLNGKLTRPPPVDLDAARARCARSIGVQECYERLRNRGLDYGPWFQRIEALWTGKGECLSEISVPDDAEGTGQPYLLHPTALDAGLQALITLAPGDAGRTWVPVLIRQMAVYAPAPARLWCSATARALDADRIEADLVFCAADGSVVADIHGLVCQAFTDLSASDLVWREWLYQTVWSERELEPAQAAAFDHVIVLGARPGHPLSRDLSSQGTTVSEASSIEDVIAGLDVAGRSAVIDARALVSGRPGQDPAGSDGSTGLIRLAQSLATLEVKPRLYVLTQDACVAAQGDHATGLASAALVGVARVILNEVAELNPTLIDLPAQPDAAVFAAIAREVLAGAAELEVALRGTARWVARIVPAAPSAETDEQAATAGPLPVPESFALDATGGGFDGLKFFESRRRAPGTDEVELRVLATSVNMKDVLKVLGHLPLEALEDTYYGESLGMEACVEVVRVGAGVRDLAPGDVLAASVRDSFQSYVTVRVDDFVWSRVPGGMRAEEAASVMTVFCTAYYALHDLARVEAGESVLIHAAAGGVGQAAVQMARWLGAEIYATAGTADKRELLQAQGCKGVFDSRSLDFVEQIRAQTGGRGVDVVLNSISGEVADRSLSLLAPGGRFLEIGKRDFLDGSRMDLRAFNRALSYFSIDLDRMLAAQRPRFQRVANAVWERLRAGDFHCPQVTEFPAAKVGDAFRYLAQSQHVGKIVVSMQATEGLEVQPLREEPPLFSPAASYLVTGGLGGFGLEVARWLVRHGVRHLALAGRTGAQAHGASNAVRELAEAGATVVVFACDVARRAEVDRLLGRIGAEMPPLRGIFHAAGVVSDAPLAAQSAEHVQRVMAPKAAAAWHLHQASSALALDHFVMFSSVSALVGNPGQANYAGANAFLDALSGHRRAAGLPSLSVNWGAIGRVGMAARDPEVAEMLRALGVNPMRPELALEALEVMLARAPAQLAIMDVDWSRWRALMGSSATSPRFAALTEALQRTRPEPALLAQLRSLEAKDRLEMATLLLAELLARTLRLPAERVDLHRPLTDIGLDSLMMVEMRVAIQRDFGVEFSTTELHGRQDLIRVADRLLNRAGLN